MNTAEDSETVVLHCGARALPRSLRGLTTLPVAGPDDRAGVDAAIGAATRLVVVGGDAELALVLSRLLRADRLDVAVAYLPPGRTPATGAYRLPTGRRATRAALRGRPQPAPLIRDDTATVLVGAAEWRPGPGAALLHGEGIVDDAALFDGDVPAVRITPTATGVRAGVCSRRGRVRRWVAGRAAQLGAPAALVTRDGVASERPVKRSTFYRHIADWQVLR